MRFKDQLLDGVGRTRVETGRRFVEEQKARRAGERAHYRKPLLLAAGEHTRRPACQVAEAGPLHSLGLPRCALRS